MTDYLAGAFPRLAARLGKAQLATLPSPVAGATLPGKEGHPPIAIKRDDVSSPLYGGNKVRKLEYILHRARERGARRVVTFGTVGSNHALATSLFAAELGLACTCFLGPQRPAPGIARTLNMHRRLGTEIIPVGDNGEQLDKLRRNLHGRRCWVIPMGGSSWLGAVGFVNAGLELAAQVAAGELAAPDRIYIANGTMGSSAGLALGLALAGLPSELHAVRVTAERYASRNGFDRLLKKTLAMLRRLDPSVPADAVEKVRLRWRDEFFAGGYALADATTRSAVATAREGLGLSLETTYTGKAMAALLHDLAAADYRGARCLFWNTYNSRELPVTGERPADRRNLPAEFMHYFD